MANIKFIAVSRGLRGIVDYVTNREKTVEQLISGVNCVARTAVPEFEAGMKFHQSAREMQQVKDYCSQLCREHGLSVTESKADPFRIPMWKKHLTDHIKEAMEQSRTQQEFIAYMNAYGYNVKWEPHQKYITYTTPENIRCRDSKLFDQTLKRENMELYFRLGGADYLQACREIAYDYREPTPTLEDAVCGMAGTVAAICALCEDEDSEVSDLARELYYSSLLLQDLVEWYQSRRQEREITRKNMSSITVSI